MASPRSYYDTLNVSPDAEVVVIEAAYRALMKKYHPDQGAPPPREGAPTAAAINEAYAVLREPGRRAEYDQKEWIRQQNIQLASYVPPPPPRRTNFFGWGGWLVALVLAGMFGLLAAQGQIDPVSRNEAERAALLAEPDLRSQPFEPGEKTLTAAETAEIRADAYVGTVPATLAPRALAQVEAPRAAARRPAASRPRKPPRRPISPAQRKREKDFLERQGYIY